MNSYCVILPGLHYHYSFIFSLGRPTYAFEKMLIVNRCVRLGLPQYIEISVYLLTIASQYIKEKVLLNRYCCLDKSDNLLSD